MPVVNWTACPQAFIIRAFHTSGLWLRPSGLDRDMSVSICQNKLFCGNVLSPALIVTTA
jgi:hypothetical protein